MKTLNHQTEHLIDLAKESISDSGVFSEDQINLLLEMLTLLGKAIEKEFNCQGSCV